MKYLHRPEGSRALDAHRGDGQAASDTCTPLLDRQSIDAGDTVAPLKGGRDGPFLERASKRIKHLIRFHRSGISNDVCIDRECRHCDDLNNLGLLKAVLTQRFVIFFRQTMWIT